MKIAKEKMCRLRFMLWQISNVANEPKISYKQTVGQHNFAFCKAAARPKFLILNLQNYLCLENENSILSLS